MSGSLRHKFAAQVAQTLRTNRMSPLKPRLNELVDVHRDIVNFVLLSGACWIFDLALLLIISFGLSWKPASANIASSLLAAIVVYTVAHHRIHRGQSTAQVARLVFYLCYTLGVVVAASWTLEAIHSWLGAFLRSAFAAMIIAKVMVTPLQLLCNFLVSRGIARTRRI